MLARTDTNGSTYYHADGNGNITALIDGNGNIAARYLYDPYGRLIGQWGPLAAASVYRFSSKEYDADSGLYYYGARYYDPTLQRWLNRDPIQEAGGINLYGFVGNSPVNVVDPFGTDWPWMDANGGLHYSTPPSQRQADPSSQYTVASMRAQYAGPVDNNFNGKTAAQVTTDVGMAVPKGILTTAAMLLPLGPGEAGLAGAEDAAAAAKAAKAASKCEKAAKALPKIDPNKLNHIFGDPTHNLAPFLSQFGGDQAQAFTAIQQAMQAVADTQHLQGIFRSVPVQIGSQTVTVSGNVINGVVNVGTAFIVK